MVSATLLFTRCVAIALLGATSARASKFEDNPVTTSFEDKAPLDHRHPAFGADVAPEVIEYRIAEVVEPLPRVTNDSTPQPEATVGAAESRRLEASNADIERLEKYFGMSMELNFATLDKQYKSAQFDPAPWPSSYWPVYADGINYRWQGSDVLSPSEKYATAYGLSVKDFTAKVSQSNGILSQSRRRSCKVTSECNSLNDGSICGIRQGESKGYCIPGWFGICHAWAPAAILEKEPKCTVKKGNVTFQPYDIKGLLTQIYDGANVDTVFTGARFNGPDTPAVFDEYGRYKDAARRDLGAGFFHIAVTNIMGKFKKSFVVDVTAGSEVWNQPVRNYEVAETKTLTLSQGAKEYFQTNKYPFNSDAKSLMYVNTKFRWIVESGEDGPLVETGKVDEYTQTGNYEYLLELDAQKNIIGGEWVGKSRTDHPDFLWFPTGRPAASTVTNVGLSYKNVLELLDASVRCVDLNSVPTPTPELNPSPTPTSPPDSTPTPTTEPPAPTPTSTPAPAPETPAPTPETPAPTPETPAPTTEAPAPTTEAPASAPTSTPAPTPGTPAPTPETPAPTPETPAPTTEAPAPTTEAPASAPTSTPAPTLSPTPTTSAPTAASTPKPSPSPASTPRPASTPSPTAQHVCSTPRGGSCGGHGQKTRCCPSGEYCLPLNKWYHQCTPVPSKCLQQQIGVSYGGKEFARIYNIRASDCCERCSKTHGCKGYTFYNSNGKGQSECHLKNDISKTHKKEKAVSAAVTPQQQQQQQQQQGYKLWAN